MLKKWKILPGLMVAALILIAVGGQTVFARATHADYDCDAQTSLPVDECQSLVALYNATGGEEWSNSSGWLTNNDLCAWHGVSCNEGHVAALDLFNNNLSGNLPIDIGGFPFLKTLTINDNPLSGPLPITITFLDLDLFHFHGTSLCEPADPAFQDWFSQIVYRLSSGLYCSTVAPTNTPDPAVTTAAGELPWPQQTLTALAIEDSQPPGIPTATLELTPTRYYSLQTATRPVVDNSDQASGSFGGIQEDDTQTGKRRGAGFLGNIPSTWLLLLLIPVGLIVVGILLEVRDRRQEKEKAGDSTWLEFGRKNDGDKKKEKVEEPDEEDFDMYDFDPS